MKTTLLFTQLDRSMNLFKTLVLFLFTFISGASQAQCSDLFFSEYLEGASNNRAVEIYNPTPNPIDLSNYVLYRYNHGSALASDSLFPEGMLASGDVYVISNPSAQVEILNESDTLHTLTFYNGDDAIELRVISGGILLDVIGEVGVDPGTNWPVGIGATSEFTLVRMIGIQGGTTSWATSSTQWDVHPQNTFTFLGSHSMTACCVNTSFTDSQSACDSLLWMDGVTYYSSNNTATHTIPNAAGCDSLITLDLTITESTTYTDVQAACDSLLWINGVTYYSSNNIATHTIPNAVGCDSLITLDLTMEYSTTANQTESALDSYTWPINNQTYTASGQYTATIPNAAGCDSTITLDLTMSFTGINEHERVNVQLYPNPVKAVLNLKTEENFRGNYIVLDLNGRELISGELNEMETAVSVSELEAGTYFIYFDSYLLSLKFVKE